MVERRLIALFLVSLGVWLGLGAAWALIVAGAGVAVSGVEPRPVVDAAVARIRGGAAQVRAIVSAMPRRSSAVGLVLVATVLLPVAALGLLGTYPALAVLGGIFLVDGHLLGWE